MTSTSRATMRVLIVEDEPIARAALRNLLLAHPWVEVIAVSDNGDDAIAAIDRERPDIVFLDIELPGCSGLDVVRAISHQPLVIFTTAYDQHAVAAFELAALDYLLKPFGPERLAAALARARRAVDDEVGVDSRERLEAALTDDHGAPLTRFFVRDRGRMLLIRADDVERLEADDDYVRVSVKGRVHLVYLTLNDFERRLDPQRFLRIHRAHLVNLDYVSHLNPYDGGRIEVILRDGTRLLASRTRSRELRRLTL